MLVTAIMFLVIGKLPAKAGPEMLGMIDQEKCTGCGACVPHCDGFIVINDNEVAEFAETSCCQPDASKVRALLVGTCSPQFQSAIDHCAAEALSN
jgi:Fe-S-cluster-containing hydrogenase component 2